jgi:hypothetical protein
MVPPTLHTTRMSRRSSLRSKDDDIQDIIGNRLLLVLMLC